jgi:hypothetical protein
MPNYEIHYLNDDGALAHGFSADCSTDMQAKILAHAMKPAGFQRIEVWDADALIYERPERDATPPYSSSREYAPHAAG